MKIFIFKEDFIQDITQSNANDSRLIADLHLELLSNKNHEEIERILDNIFRKYYYVQAHYMENERTRIITYLFENKEVFEKVSNYEKFLVMIFIHLVIIKKYDEIVEELIVKLKKFYNIDFSTFQLELAKFSFLQYCAAYYHTHHMNAEAIQIFEYIGQGEPENNKDFSATNNFLLTCAYISSGRLYEAAMTCQQAANEAAKTNNYKRFLYCQMNQARLCSAAGRFEEAISLYKRCLEGGNMIDLKLRKNIIPENIATVYMYQKEYQKAIDAILTIDPAELNNNAAYICALSYFEIGNTEKAKEWTSIGKQVISVHKTAEMFINLVETMLRGNGEKVIDCLGEMNIYLSETENYASYNFITRRLIKEFAKLKHYKEAYEFTEFFFKL